MTSTHPIIQFNRLKVANMLHVLLEMSNLHPILLFIYILNRKYTDFQSYSILHGLLLLNFKQSAFLDLVSQIDSKSGGSHQLFQVDVLMHTFIYIYIFSHLEHQHQLCQSKFHFNTPKPTLSNLTHHFTIHPTSHLLF